MLVHIAGCAQTHRFLHVGRIIVEREHDESGVAAGAGQFPEEVNPADAGHLDVQHDKIRLVQLNEVEGGHALIGFADDVEVGL